MYYRIIDVPTPQYATKILIPLVFLSHYAVNMYYGSTLPNFLIVFFTFHVQSFDMLLQLFHA